MEPRGSYLLTIHGHLRSTINRHNPLFGGFTRWLPYFPLNVRKSLLDIAQTGRDDDSPEIQLILQSIYKNTQIGPDGEALGRREITEYVREISRTPFNRSLTMMLVRCETFLISNDGGQEALVEGLNKEVQASQNIFSLDQTLNYSTVFGDGRVQWGPFAPITPAWSQNALYLANRISRNIAKLRDKIIYPRPQRKKNMSRQSCDNLLSLGYKTDRSNHDLRTVDLEIHRYFTGEEAQGSIEMRWSWKYNVLKPRVYYCTGASSYWRSRYMRLIASTLMDSWPMTHVERRKSPDELTWYLEEDDYLTLWDYESFTTNLSELKFFVYWMSRYLEQNLVVRNSPLRLFDWRDGIIEANLWEMLDAYNEDVNVYARFDIHRVLDILGIDNDLEMAQHNSGSLGVLGNIGLSTQLHGIHIGPIVTSKEKGVSVGDDAFAMQKLHPDKQLIPHIQTIGKIHPEKFSVMKPILHEVEFQVGKFLKRRLTRDDHGIHLDVLYDFPLLAYVFDINPGLHTVPPMDRLDISHKFVGQVGALFWNILNRGFDFTDGDISFLVDILIVCYKRLRLPLHGALPGHKTAFDTSKVYKMAIPPLLDFDPRLDNWAEFLWDRSLDQFVLLPVDQTVPIPPQEFVYVGQEFKASPVQLLNILEDLRIVERGDLDRQYFEVSSENKWVFKRMVTGDLSDVYTYKFLTEPPEYYNDIVSSLFRSNPDPGLVDLVGVY